MAKLFPVSPSDGHGQGLGPWQSSSLSTRQCGPPIKILSLPAPSSSTLNGTLEDGHLGVGWGEGAHLSSAFPATSLGFINCREIFAYVTFGFFFNPTIEAVTCRPCGWCMLGVFLLTLSSVWDMNVGIC